MNKENNIHDFWRGLSKEIHRHILEVYSLVSFPPKIINEPIPFIGNRIYLMYKFPNGYAIYQIVGYKQYELKEIIGEVPEELLKGLDHDANHRAWISREYDTKTPVLAYDKQKSNIMDLENNLS